jgi:hypothetical protein
MNGAPLVELKNASVRIEEHAVERSHDLREGAAIVVANDRVCPALCENEKCKKAETREGESERERKKRSQKHARQAGIAKATHTPSLVMLAARLLSLSFLKSLARIMPVFFMSCAR